MSHTSKSLETPSSKEAKPSAQPEAKNTGAAEETQGGRKEVKGHEHLQKREKNFKRKG